MKTASYKIFYLLFQFAFFVLTIGLILLVTVNVIALVRDNEESYSIGAYADYDLEIDPKIINVKSEVSELADSHLESYLSTVRFKTKDKSVKLFMTILVAVKVFYVLAILLLLRRFVLSLKSEQLFNLKNVGILKSLGILVLLRIPFEYLYRYIVNAWINNHFVMDMLYANTPHSAGYAAGYALGVIAGGGNSFLLGWGLTGLLILVIAEVFRQGLIMKEEQDLTI